MKKRVLIISDNYFLSQKFHEIIKKKQLNNCEFTFSISPFSDKKKFNNLKVDKLKVFDLKSLKDVQLIRNNYDLVFSIHCKQIFPLDLINSVKCINIHPGYNPINRGWYPQVFSIVNKQPVGATIHEIDEKLDHGGIIVREFVNKHSYDTSESLYNRILTKEIELLDLNIEKIIHGDYKVFLPESEGTLHLKKDFNNLLELDLEEQATVGEVIDKLRALTHGEFKNAYFIDKITKEKIFVSVDLRPENND